MTITLERVKSNLEYWLKADETLSKGKNMTINGGSITLPSMDEVTSRINYRQRKVKQLSLGGKR
jgi:hypothetical protein